MAVSGVRARNFIRGGTASSIFAARRGMSAARPARAAAPRGETAKFGKTTGQDFVKFVSGDKNTKAIRSAVNNLKNMLVEGFMAAKSLQASVGNIVGQLKGSGGGRGGKGIGLFGIFAAIAIAVGALLVPKIKEAVKFLYKQANNIFKFIQGTIRTIYQGVQKFVSDVREWINTVNGGIASINDKVKGIFTVIGQGDNAPQIPELPTIKENLLPDLKFLEEGYSLDNLLGDTVAGAGNILGDMFGGAKDMFQGMLGGLLGTTPPASPASSAEPSASTQSSSPSTSGDAVSQARELIIEKEGFREMPYYDVNAFRAGYGSDTYTTESGEVKQVVEGQKVSRADADRDIDRRIKTEFMPRAKAGVGEDVWSTLPSQAKAALTSIAYNYGSLPDRVTKVAKSTGGNLEAIAKAVEGLKTDDKGINANRRQYEADLIRNSRVQPASPINRSPSASSKGNVSIINAPGQQIAQAPPRPRPLTSTNPPGGSSSPTVAFYGSSNPDSFDHVLAKATYSVTG